MSECEKKVMIFSDPFNPQASELADKLHADGCSVVGTADYIGDSVAIENYRASLVKSVKDHDVLVRVDKLFDSSRLTQELTISALTHGLKIRIVKGNEGE